MKSWNNQFKELFLDFENEPFFETYAEGGTLPGWLWECDDFGDYLSCSPEVEEVLGYSSQEMKGKPFTGFALPAKSARKVSNVLKMGNFPIEVSVEFIAQNGDLVPASLFIYDAVTTEGKNTGLRGFVQVQIEPDKNQASDVSETLDRKGVVGEMEKEKSGKLSSAQLLDIDIQRTEDEGILDEDTIESKAAKVVLPEISDDPIIRKTEPQDISKKIVKGLEKIKTSSQVIIDAPLSRVTVAHQEEFRIDRAKEPLVNETLAGKVVHSYPKVLFRETEHRLEWGTKFDLTNEEKSFLSRYRLCPPGIQGFLKQRFAPKSILKCDYDWISVVIQEEHGEEPRIWIHYSKEGEKTGGWSVQEVLEKPDVLFNEVEKSIRTPRQVRVILVRGENYLLG